MMKATTVRGESNPVDVPMDDDKAGRGCTRVTAQRVATNGEDSDQQR